jgi:hypothetical protein
MTKRVKCLLVKFMMTLVMLMMLFSEDSLMMAQTTAM